MGHRTWIRLVTGLLGLLLAACPLLAQIDRASISGTITDPSGALVSGASVTVTNTDTGQSATVTTGSDGSYTASLLHIGTYSVEATAGGFQKTLQSGVILNVNQVARVDLQLKVGTVNRIHASDRRVPATRDRNIVPRYGGNGEANR